MSDQASDQETSSEGPVREERANRTPDSFIELGYRYAREDGFVPLKPGERVPQRWYMANPKTGHSDIPINEREKVS
jgi:hypothetical protein